MRLKIHGGTVQNGQASLCAACKYATVVKGRSLREEIVECGQLTSGHNLIPFPVTSCTGYVHRQHPSIREMEEIPEAEGALRSAGRRVAVLSGRRIIP